MSFNGLSDETIHSQCWQTVPLAKQLTFFREVNLFSFFQVDTRRRCKMAKWQIWNSNKCNDFFVYHSSGLWKRNEIKRYLFCILILLCIEKSAIFCLIILQDIQFKVFLTCFVFSTHFVTLKVAIFEWIDVFWHLWLKIINKKCFVFFKEK